jgi:hypothetical protein
MTIFQGLILNGTEVINNAWIVGNTYFDTKGTVTTIEPYTGVGTATLGAPRMHLGALTPSNDDSCIKICRNIVGSNLFSHAIRDESTFNSLVTGAYASFDSIPTLTGNIVYNHLNSFQSRQQYTGGGTLTDSLGFTYNLTTSGHIVAASAFRAYDYAGVGVVDNFYVLYVGVITKPTAHWVIYSPGTSKSYHAGNFGINTTNPLSPLTVQGDTVAPTVFQDANNGQITIWSPGLVNTVEKITFATPNYSGTGAAAAIGAKFTGGGTYLFLGTSSTYTGISNTALRITPSSALEFPDSADKLYAAFGKSADDGFLFCAGNDNNYANRNIIITDYANIAKNHDHNTLSVNPTLFIHSATDPDVANTQWISLAHDQTNGVITTGKGSLSVVLPNPAVDVLTINGGINTYGNLQILQAGSIFGHSNGAAYGYLFYAYANAQVTLALGGTAAGTTLNNLVITNVAHYVKNFDHAASTNPTLFIHSATDPDVNNTQWISMTHDQTNAVISTGKGDLILDPVTEITEVCGVGLKTKEYNLTLNDDVKVNLPAGTGWGTFMIGDNQEYARIRWTAGAVVTLDEGTANVALADTDTFFCLYDDGPTVAVKNRLGANLVLRYVIHYS